MGYQVGTEGYARHLREQREIRRQRKAAGGPEYAAWRKKLRDEQRARRAAGLGTGTFLKGDSLLRRQNRRFQFCRSAAKTRKLEFTIHFNDLEWPEVCPVLGIPIRYGQSTPQTKDSAASLDRWDTSRGYVPGNVFVISFRANRLKSNATAAELQAVANYAKTKPGTSMEGLEGLI